MFRKLNKAILKIATFVFDFLAFILEIGIIFFRILKVTFLSFWFVFEFGIIYAMPDIIDSIRHFFCGKERKFMNTRFVVVLCLLFFVSFSAILTNPKVTSWWVQHQILSEHPDAVLDIQTGNLICKEADAWMLKEPIQAISLCGQTLVLKRSVAKRLIHANDMLITYLSNHPEITADREPGCILVSNSIISNHLQTTLFNDGYENQIEPCLSPHARAEAFDVVNWRLAQPFLEMEGFMGGENSNSGMPPEHFADRDETIAHLNHLRSLPDDSSSTYNAHLLP